MTNYTISSNIDITNLQLSDGAYRCYMLLQSLCYKDKTTCYPSEKYLARALGRCVRTVQRYIDELVSLNLITKRRRGSISNIYTLVKKKIQQGIDKVKQAVKGNKKREVGSDTLAENTVTESDCNRKNKQNNYYNNKNYYNKIKKDNFNNYNQRNYNYNKLEKILLGQEKYDPDILEK